jgi:hypothetical protein
MCACEGGRECVREGVSMRERVCSLHSLHLPPNSLSLTACMPAGKEVKTETQRINATGAWIYDGRVCNILAVSRAFGDWEFKGEGRETLLPRGVQRKYWSQKFADSKTIKADPVIVTPAFR